MTTSIATTKTTQTLLTKRLVAGNNNEAMGSLNALKLIQFALLTNMPKYDTVDIDMNNTTLHQAIAAVNRKSISCKKYYTMKPQALAIYDNGGKTLDRYTIVIGHDVYGMSDNPSHPTYGFNQYCGDVSQIHNPNLGKKRLLEELPKEVRLAIAERLDL